MAKWVIEFTKTVYGVVVVEGKTRKQAQEAFDSGEWQDEHENNSEYEWTSELKRDE